MPGPSEESGASSKVAFSPEFRGQDTQIHINPSISTAFSQIIADKSQKNWTYFSLLSSTEALGAAGSSGIEHLDGLDLKRKKILNADLILSHKMLI